MTCFVRAAARAAFVSAMAVSALTAADATLITFSGAFDNGQTTLPSTYQPILAGYANDGAALGVTIDWGGSWSSQRASNGGVTDHTPGGGGLGVVGYDGGAQSNTITFDRAVNISSFYYANYYSGGPFSITFNGYANVGDLIPLISITNVYTQNGGYDWIEETGLNGYAITALEFSGDNFKQLDDISIAAVPEAASWAMMVCGFGLLGAAMRRRKPNTLYA